MIDVHCHMEQPDYQKDRDQVIDNCKKTLKAVITSCAHPKDFQLTMEMVRKYRGFVFATVGIHPEYIKDISEREKHDFLGLIRHNKNNIMGIGEVGLDYHWIKEDTWREKQKELFIEMIDLSKELKKPLVIHSREAYGDTIKILEQEDCKNVLLHMFGANHMVKELIKNKWYVSLNTIILRSKKHKKIARDMPLENLLLETDSPWLAPKEWEQKQQGGCSQRGRGPLVRNDPTSVIKVAEKISEIKRISLDEVKEQTTKNAVRFFRLPIKI